MRLFSSQLVLLCALAAPAATLAQTAVYPAETQPALDVERDPVVSPDAADNIGAKPGALTDESKGNKGPQELNKESGRFTLRQDVSEVILNATVLDEGGRLVQDLTKDDFHIFEDGVPQTIAAFTHSDTPVSIGLLVDNSGSMRSKRSAVNAAALDLVKLSNPQDEAFVVNFSDEAFIDQDFTSNLAKLQEGLAHFDSKGGTALYDAAVASADELSKGAKKPKQVILIITDGEDNASGLTLEQTIRRVQDLQGPIVYCIGLLFGDEGGGHEARQAKRALQLLAQETGGIAYFPKSLNDVDGIAQQVARDIRSQYTLGYHSTKPAAEGGFRQVRVLARNPANAKKLLNVRTRSGYYPKTSKPAAGEQQVSQGGGF